MQVGRVSMRSKQQELTLLFLCARTHVSDETAARIRVLIAEGISWQVFSELAQQHGLVSLCLRNLQGIVADSVPQEELTSMRASVQQMTWHGLLLLGELCKLMTVFNTHGVQAIPFKGPTLSSLAYGDPVLRMFGDLDILVPPHEAAQAAQLLESAGYQPWGTPDGTTLTVDTPGAFHAIFKHTVTDVHVELLWKADEFDFIRPYDSQYAVTPSPTLTLGGTPMRMLSPECLLLALCSHGALHRWRQLKWLCDIAELLRRDAGIDWSRTVVLARESGNLRVLHLALLLVQELLAGDVPVDLLQQARTDRVAVSLAAEIQASLGEPTDPATAQAEMLSFTMRAKERESDRWTIVRRYLASSTPVDAMGVAAAIAFLTTLMRPLHDLR